MVVLLSSFVYSCSDIRGSVFVQCCAVFSFLSSFASIVTGKLELVAFSLFFWYFVSVIVLCLSLFMVQWVSLQCVIVEFQIIPTYVVDCP